MLEWERANPAFHNTELLLDAFDAGIGSSSRGSVEGAVGNSAGGVSATSARGSCRSKARVAGAASACTTSSSSCAHAKMHASANSAASFAGAVAPADAPEDRRGASDVPGLARQEKLQTCSDSSARIGGKLGTCMDPGASLYSSNSDGGGGVLRAKLRAAMELRGAMHDGGGSGESSNDSGQVATTRAREGAACGGGATRCIKTSCGVEASDATSASSAAPPARAAGLASAAADSHGLASVPAPGTLEPLSKSVGASAASDPAPSSRAACGERFVPKPPPHPPSERCKSKPANTRRPVVFPSRHVSGSTRDAVQLGGSSASSRDDTQREEVRDQRGALPSARTAHDQGVVPLSLRTARSRGRSGSTWAANVHLTEGGAAISQIAP